jgi:D-3-phosphoglycerate dehydrogenase
LATYRVLIAFPLIHSQIEAYEHRFRENDIEFVVPDIDSPYSGAELRAVIGDYDGIISGVVPIDEETFEVADRLQVVSRFGIGLDMIDLEAAEQHDVVVFNTPGAFAAEIADVVIAYLTMLTRNLHVVDRNVRNGEWPAPRGMSLGGLTLGIVGIGNIGSAVAKRAHAHGMELIGHDIKPIEEKLVEETGITQVSLERLFEESDAVSLNCPLTPATRGLVGKEELRRLGPEGYLINTARGELLDECELVNALEDGHLAGAALEVFETEPLPETHPLTSLDNTVLGAHNAGNTSTAIARTTERTVENLIAGLGEGQTRT